VYSKLYQSLLCANFFSLAIIVAILFTDFVSMNSFAQDNNATTEELISLGPLTFSSKIDLGMLIAAAAFASTIVYNYTQTRKAEKNLRREIEDRAVEQKQSMDAQQAQIEANQEQVQNDRRISEAGFWLTLRDQLAKYDDIDSYFLPGGKWMGFESRMVVEKGPENPEEWSKSIQVVRRERLDSTAI
jgi:hypothetical protein